MPRHARAILAPGMLAAAIAACSANAPSAADVADRGWQAHERVVAAGERATTCAVAGAAMQLMLGAHRRAFVDAIALDRDPRRLAEATAYLEAHTARYADLETRMVALAERCAGDPGVEAVFARMEAP